MSRIKKLIQVVIEISQTQIFFTQSVRVKWFSKIVATIAKWFSRKNFVSSKCLNVIYYLKDVKIENAKKCFDNLNLIAIMLSVISQKLVEKLANMMSMFKNMRNKIDFTNWNVDFDDHNQSMIDQKHIVEIFIIKTIIVAKVFWYYEFEKIMSERSNVTSIFLFESEQSNRRNLQIVASKNVEKQNNNDIDVENDVLFEENWSTNSRAIFSEFVAELTQNLLNDDEINDKTKKNVRKKKTRDIQIDEMLTRFEIFDANFLNKFAVHFARKISIFIWLIDNAFDDVTNSENLTQNIFFFVLFSVKMFAKFADSTIIKVFVFKFFAFAKISAKIFAKTSAKFVHAKFFKQVQIKKDKRVHSYDFENDTNQKRNKKKKKTISNNVSLSTFWWKWKINASNLLWLKTNTNSKNVVCNSIVKFCNATKKQCDKINNMKNACFKCKYNWRLCKTKIWTKINKKLNQKRKITIHSSISLWIVKILTTFRHRFVKQWRVIASWWFLHCKNERLKFVFDFFNIVIIVVFSLLFCSLHIRLICFNFLIYSLYIYS